VAAAERSISDNSVQSHAQMTKCHLAGWIECAVSRAALRSQLRSALGSRRSALGARLSALGALGATRSADPCPSPLPLARALCGGCVGS
jgi:hypothetical protein